MKLSPEEVRRIEEAVLGPQGRPLMDLMRHLTMFQPIDHVPEEVRAEARTLGWIDGTNFPTKLGWLVGNPLRELLLWEERQGKLHMQAEFPILQDATFRNQRVLEVGCGTGCNLLSLQPLASQVLGVEIEPLFLQLTPLICKLANRPIPDRLEGQGEALPAQNAAWDVAIIMGSLQYMQIEKVLQEVGRVLVPGGLGIFILSDFSGAVKEFVRVMPSLRPKGLAKELVLLAGNLTYPLMGRVYQPAGTPVYPPQAAMKRWIQQAGLSFDPRSHRHGNEMCYLATKK